MSKKLTKKPNFYVFLLYYQTKLVFFSRIALLSKPIPTENKHEPAKHNKTLTKVLLSGVIIGIIINISIPIPKDTINDRHNFCFAKMLAKTYIEEKIPTSKTFDNIHIITFPAVAPSSVKDRPATPPPIIEPTKNAIIILAPFNKTSYCF